MKIGMKTQGWGTVDLALANVGRRAPANAARSLRRAVIRIRDRAEDYTPEDEGHLAESIRIEEVKIGRRIQFSVVVGNDTVTKHNGREVNLNQYALIIHESYSQFQPGPNTLDKMARVGADKVGERFLERAVQDDKQLYEYDIFEALMDVIRAEGVASTKTLKEGSR